MQDLADRVRGLLDGQSLWLAPGHGLAPDDSVVVATSGTGGQAKLVVLRRTALQAAAAAAAARLGFTATWHLALPGHYVAGLMVIVRGLLGDGVRSVAGPALEGVRFADGANAISLVPTQLYRALDTADAAKRLARFDAVLVGGARLDERLADRARQEGIRIVETYGMSETCGGIVWDGVPLPTVDVMLSPSGRISIASPTVFSGYFGRPDLTAECLSGGVVHTRDRGHWRDGRLVVDGRDDDIVITGGVNVDLGVVRAAASRCDPDTEVLAVADDEWGSRIVLFASEGNLDTWRDRLRCLLPAVALPRQVVTLSQLPRTAGGKPDRQVLLQLVEP